MGWDGMDGTVHQKGALIFFILRYIKHYTYKNLYIYKKSVLTNFLWVLNFGQVGDPRMQKFKNTLLGGFFYCTKSQPSNFTQH